MKQDMTDSQELDNTPVVHRDLSWLSFNERVLQEAKDKRNPLYERIKFLGIYSKNLGEFFHVRMPYHLNLIRINKRTRKKLHYSPKKLIKQITGIVNQQQVEFTRIFEDEIIPELRNHDIYVKDLTSISTAQRLYIENYFFNTMRIYVDPVLMRGKSVNPFLKDGSLYLGIILNDNNLQKSNHEYGLVRIPSDVLPRFIILPSKQGHNDVILLDDILRYGLKFLFTGFNVTDAYSFKMTRDAELYIDNDFSGNLKDAVKRSLSKRKVGTPARFVYDRNMPQELIDLLTFSFDLHKYDKIKEGRYQNFYDFINFPSFQKPELQNKPLKNITYPILENNTDIWNAIKTSDHLIHPPYHSFESAVTFFEKAASDPQVTEILITQYRIGKNSKILDALIDAAKSGKKITVFLEVQARFDEQSNLEWGEKLESAGITVIYSIPGLKVHCKIGLIKRKENSTVSNYALLSTGNFHEDNSRVYSDMCLFTADSAICQEIDNIFNYFNQALPRLPNFKHLLVGKRNLRSELEALIDREIDQAKKGKTGYILLKMNSLEDKQMIDKLYEASQANVKIDLIVRGICCLVPGIPEISDNIQAISIVDRYLEHSRAYYFLNDGESDLYLSSADWMTRNLSLRIEVAFPIYCKKLKSQIMQTLNIQLADNTKARIINQYSAVNYKKSPHKQVRSQEAIHRMLLEVS